MWLRANILNWLVFPVSTTVRAIRVSLREADHAFSANLRIIVSVSSSGTSCSKVSSVDTGCVGLFERRRYRRRRAPSS